MGLTVLCVTEAAEQGMIARRLFVSNEYSVDKDDGEKEWRHPDPKTLRYTQFATLNANNRISGLMHTVLYFGIDSFGGQLLLIEDEAADILAGREQTWEEKIAQDEEFYAELRRIQYEQMRLEEQRRAPIYEFCTRCRSQQEACKNAAHRGRRCMVCCGGLGDRSNRYCSNCLDLPYREKREKGCGEAIVYAGEEE